MTFFVYEIVLSTSRSIIVFFLIIIDIIISIFIVLYCSVLCDVYNLTEILKKYSPIYKTRIIKNVILHF